MDQHLLDLILVSLGLSLGIATKLRTPILLTMFLIKVVKWWFETHPDGKETARKTNLDEEFKTKFVDDLEKIEKKLGIDKK